MAGSDVWGRKDGKKEGEARRENRRMMLLRTNTKDETAIMKKVKRESK